jgi:hypothetical protein
MSGGFAPPPGGVEQQHGAATGQAEMPTSQLEISVRCQKLGDRDVLSKSDPMCVMFLKPQGGTADAWIEVGRTEMMKDSLNPEWIKKFEVDYSFEEMQVVKFEVYDVDIETYRLSDQDFLGRCETSLGKIVSAQGKCFTSSLSDTRGYHSESSTISITAEELEANKEVVTLQFQAENLDKKDFFGKSDPYYILSKSAGNGHFTVVKKSNVIMNTLEPLWTMFNIPVRDLCNNNYDRTLKIDVYDWDENSADDLIGSATMTLASLMEAVESRKRFPLINDKKQAKKKSYHNSGKVYVNKATISKELSFLDYIQGGTTINFSVAIDFTASNGNPLDPRSLHYMAPGQDNQYVTAIKSVGGIIEDYDTDKMFPALGFGAKVPPMQQVSHEFFLNLSTDSPYCKGMEGLLAAYHTSIQNVSLYGPTNFSPVIKHVAKFAKAYQDGSQYFILLIITDGEITDMECTKYAIVEASQLPMSIIIVGVGDEGFQAMRELDGDDGMMRVGKIKATRDIVQFVELKKYIGTGGCWHKALLAKEVLAEVPRQLTNWAKANGIKPPNT